MLHEPELDVIETIAYSNFVDDSYASAAMVASALNIDLADAENRIRILKNILGEAFGWGSDDDEAGYSAEGNGYEHLEANNRWPPRQRPNRGLKSSTISTWVRQLEYTVEEAKAEKAFITALAAERGVCHRSVAAYHAHVTRRTFAA